MNTTTTTAPPSVPNLPAYSGFLFLLGSSFLYGSNYLPVKQYETGDGMYFQLILCSAIWTVGLLVYLARNLPTFYALPMLGGFLWATGNVNTVIIIRTIGIGLGMLFWNVVGLVTGWGTARYGWFGVKKQVPSDLVLNYIGVALAILSTLFYLFVKTDARIKSDQSSETVTPIDDTDAVSINHSNANLTDVEPPQTTNQPNPDFLDRLSPNLKRAIGIVLAIFSGVLYGESNTPVLLARDQYEADGNYLDYLFSFYTGIFASSIGYFLIYTVGSKFKPKIYPQVTLAAFVSGWMWGGANLCYFMATNALTQSISYPISASGPPIFASLWGIFLYKEIRGIKNFAFLLSGFAIAIAGSILVGLSF